VCMFDCCLAIISGPTEPRPFHFSYCCKALNKAKVRNNFWINRAKAIEFIVIFKLMKKYFIFIFKSWAFSLKKSAQVMC